MRFLERTPVRVAAFAVALATVFALALGIGSQVGPIKAPAVAGSDSHGTEEGHGMEGAEHTADLPGGTKALNAMNDLRNRVDELGKKVRGIDELERRVAALEAEVAVLKGEAPTEIQTPA